MNAGFERGGESMEESQRGKTGGILRGEGSQKRKKESIHLRDMLLSNDSGRPRCQPISETLSTAPSTDELEAYLS
jgi:hypothetical protein